MLDNLRRPPFLSSCISGIHAQAIIAPQIMKVEKTISIERKLRVLRLSMLVLDVIMWITRVPNVPNEAEMP